MVTENNQLMENEDYKLFSEHPFYKKKFLAGNFKVAEDKALALYAEIVSGIHFSSGYKREPLLKIGTEVVPGGWDGKGGYNNTNSRESFDPALQAVSVFPFGGSNTEVIDAICLESEVFCNFLDEVRTNLIKESSELAKRELQCCQAHVLLGVAQESQFGWHQDYNTFKKFVPDLSVVCQLSQGVAGMKVAGAEEVLMYEGPGACSFFDTHLWHRTDRTEQGTLRLTLFFKFKNRFVKLQPEKKELKSDNNDDDDPQEPEK